MALPTGTDAALALQVPPAPTSTPPSTPSGQAELAMLQALFASQWLDVLRALLVIVVGIGALRLALNWTSSAMRRARVDTGTQILVRRGISVACLVVTALVVLGILGVSAAGLVTVVGAVGLAFSLAIQDILKNFFSGVYLLLERPFRVGDTIRVRDQEGVVENIGVRTTSLRTPDDVYVLVPNMIVFAEVVANRSHAQPGQPAVAGGHDHPVAAPTPAAEADTPQAPTAPDAENPVDSDGRARAPRRAGRPR